MKAAVVAVMIAWSGAALAAGANDAPMSVNGIVDALTLKEQPVISNARAKPGVERGLNLARGTNDKTAVEPSSQIRKLDFKVEFEFNSATLLPSATEVLDLLGQALTTSDLKGYRFRIGGHTDAIGSPTYNKQLSARRANAVKDYLSDRFGISPDRLEIMGYGSEMPLDPRNPKDGRNRRVEIANLGHRTAGVAD
ncbi:MULTISPECIES: OmpA family protein [Azospirillum]|uniref:OmpA family protein n=1 Tax=Azospirillum TaxID=191 RepID=UPI0013B461B2|nr:OmpA family protein [Azospirillum brasilense]